MEEQINNLMTEDLTDSEIRILCPDTKVFLFNELARFDRLEELFTRSKTAIILFPVKSIANGHWICVIDHGTYVEHFDPYGFNPIKEYDYTQINIPNYLERLYTKFESYGGKLTFNTNQYQELKTGINTCGRHTSVRTRLSYLTEDRYHQLLTGQKYTPDQLVVAMTMLSIDTNK